MGKAELIYSCNLTGYRPIIWLGEAVIRRENQIRTVLAEKLGREYAELFTNINIHTGSTSEKTSADWMSSYLTKAVPFSRLSNTDKEKVREILAVLISGIQQLCFNFKNSDNKEYQELSEIIQLAVNIPSESCIYFDGEKIALVLWGFISDKPENKGVNLDKFLGNLFPEKVVKQQTETPVIKDEVKSVIPQTEKTPEVIAKIPVKHADIVKTKRRFRWWWWLIILAALVLTVLILFFLRSCHPPQLLPVNPGVIFPIDSSEIIQNPGDTLQRPVVGNRLNVILDKNTDVGKFAADFNDKFGQDASIIYYDTIIKQLQIEFYTGDIIEWKKKIKELQGVRIVFEESIFHTGYLPADPAFRNPAYNYYFSAVKAYGGWDKTKGSNTIVIAIIDDGFDLNHPELKGKIYSQWNVVENSDNVHTNSGRCFHGTHVACLAAGNIDNNSGASGIAPRCMLMPVQVSDAQGQISTTYIINGILYAINKGANVINLSLGMIFPSFVNLMPVDEQKELAATLYPEEEAFWEEMYTYTEDYNVVVVQAAGNDNVWSAIDPMKRSIKTIVVAASDETNTRTDFSNYGDRIDLTAPGYKIYSAVPDNKYSLMDGTSMASPIVAGAAGLVLSVNSSLKPVDVKKILQETGINVKTGQDKKVGPLIQLDKALNSASSYKPRNCEDVVDSLLKVIEELKRK